MALQAVGTSNFLSASLGNNPIQTLGMLSITMLAVNTLSNLPMAKADEGGFPWREYCEVQCTPITGEKTVTHQICVETCLVGKEMIKTTTEQALKNGKWEVVKQLGKVVTAIKPIGDGIDCYSICNNPLSAGSRMAGDLFMAGYSLWSKNLPDAGSYGKSAAAKAGCVALLITPAGIPGCLACCAGTKYIGVN